ncbi:DUF494 family protein [Legionella israelensis]|uniref:Protein Smg n=1 Tax=Legionella israelensis TaxID=454 RepID=A0A0W0WJJ1_9GAMM|nr:DUF494 family protein [Legionella israelensis]KTD32495.1 Protein Smg [Legionella israelensis]QBS10229.1 DUF494 family protein [Legionella israelensis]SCY32872.1 Protein of unknown function [Legionella israelensis DSM 19235]STX59822.1 Uncharacterized protein conserved in bacteria [Legionella israelensis]
MKENLFEMLLSLFEKSLAQLKKKENSGSESGTSVEEVTEEDLDSQENLICIKGANGLSTRVFTSDERLKLTKASYQFLTRLKLWGIIDARVFELILNQLLFSDSRVVSLQETKWTIRNTLADSLDTEQLAFLDLVLYQKEDQLTLH